MPRKAKLDSGLEQWKRRLEANEETLEQKSAETMTSEEVADEEHAVLKARDREQPQESEEERRSYWLIKPRPYWK